MSCLFENIGNYIETNIKDFVNICFWILTGVIAFLTYRNAKKTLFNPVRSEMVKYQMKVITDFIDNHTGKGMNLEYSLDYLALVKINYDVNYFFGIYKHYGKIEDHVLDKIDRAAIEYCKNELAGSFEVLRDEKGYYFGNTIVGDYNTLKQYLHTISIKSKEEEYKELLLQRMYFTKKFQLLYFDLQNLKTNPFIPKDVKATVDKILQNITINLILLYETLSKCIPEKKFKLYNEIYAHFEPKKIDHTKDLEELRNVINKYFKVDKV
jgi:hypothetical protein